MVRLGNTLASVADTVTGCALSVCHAVLQLPPSASQVVADRDAVFPPAELGPAFSREHGGSVSLTGRISRRRPASLAMTGAENGSSSSLARALIFRVERMIWELPKSKDHLVLSGTGLMVPRNAMRHLV